MWSTCWIKCSFSCRVWPTILLRADLLTFDNNLDGVYCGLSEAVVADTLICAGLRVWDVLQVHTGGVTGSKPGRLQGVLKWEGGDTQQTHQTGDCLTSCLLQLTTGRGSPEPCNSQYAVNVTSASSKLTRQTFRIARFTEITFSRLAKAWRPDKGWGRDDDGNVNTRPNIGQIVHLIWSN